MLETTREEIHMRMTLLFAVGTGAMMLASAIGAAGGAQTPAPAAVPTFSRDVAPILYAHCVECHRAGEIAPMPLVTYPGEYARGHARSPARSAPERCRRGTPMRRPAPSGTNAFSRQNRRTSSNAGRRQARRKAMRRTSRLLPCSHAAGASASPTPSSRCKRTTPYRRAGRSSTRTSTFQPGSREERWVQAIEARPGNRALVHHILVYYEADPDAPVEARDPRPQSRGRREAAEGTWQEAFARVERSEPPAGHLRAWHEPPGVSLGTALRLPPGGVLRFQLHYTANGTAGTDRSRVGLIFAKEPPAEELRVSYFVNRRFIIPAGSANEAVSTDVTFRQDATLWGLWPHTHLRGKRWSYALDLPDGRTTQLLSVPKYDFNWQTYYMFRQPLAIPKGARIASTAWFDNSAANRANPDPTVDVKWGDQTWEEMQYTGIMYSVKRTATVAAR